MLDLFSVYYITEAVDLDQAAQIPLKLCDNSSMMPNLCSHYDLKHYQGFLFALNKASRKVFWFWNPSNWLIYTINENKCICI